MKYLILIYQNPESRHAWESFSEAEQAQGLLAYGALNEELAASGELIVTEALADPALTKRVTLQEGRAIASDGPYAEVKEQLAGFYLVECATIERAIDIAGRIPGLDPLLVEVRPVMSYAGLEM